MKTNIISDEMAINTIFVIVACVFIKNTQVLGSIIILILNFVIVGKVDKMYERSKENYYFGEELMDDYCTSIALIYAITIAELYYFNLLF